MDQDNQTDNIEKEVEAVQDVSGAPSKIPPIAPPQKKAGQRSSFADRKKNVRRTSRREPRAKPEFDQKIIDIRRVARVVAGGRRFSFSVALVAGNRKGAVGVGTGKGGDTALAIDKALRDAKKHLIRLNLTKTMSIPHDIEAKYSSARVFMTPAPGRGVIAGSSVRTVLELAGVKDVVAKIFSGSKNRVNNAQVAIVALSRLGALRFYHLPKIEKPKV